ncbi:hypothetical protein AAC387_Pa06g0381 [Persea americana]
MKGEGLEADDEEEDVEGNWGWRGVCPVAQATIAIFLFFPIGDGVAVVYALRKGKDNELQIGQKSLWSLGKWNRISR